MNVDQVKAGMETDALVAKVMGWTDMKKRFTLFYGRAPRSQYPSMPPPYSSDIKVAWEADKPEWEWQFVESPIWLAVYLWYMAGNPPLDTNQPLVVVRIDWGEVGTKAQAYALGRCRAILKFSQCQSP